MVFTTRTAAEDSRQDDVRLIYRFADGDQTAAAEVYHAFADSLLGFILRHSRLDREDAEEVVNDTFVAALELGHSFDGSCSIFTWLCCLARYRIINVVRRSLSCNRIPQGKLVSIDDETKIALSNAIDPRDCTGDILSQIDCERIANHLLQCLSPDQCEAVKLRFIEGFSTEETAKILGKSEKAIERLVERARLSQRKSIEDALDKPKGRKWPIEVQFL